MVLRRKANIETASRGSLLYEIPFDSDRKAMSVVVRPAKSSPVLCRKAPPEVVLANCCASIAREKADEPLEPAERGELLQVAGDMASRALRVIALAYGDRVGPTLGPEVERELVFAGFVGMIDPPRDEARVAVASCRTAGIRAGDDHRRSPATALAIARELGIARGSESVLTGADLDRLSDDELRERLDGVTVYRPRDRRAQAALVQPAEIAGACRGDDGGRRE